MDQFADGMTARGPTLTADRTTWTGSLHIVDLPSTDEADEFVGREPYNRAGIFGEHVVRRFDNLLGRTMWEFPRDSDDFAFLVIAHLCGGEGEHDPSTSRAELLGLTRERVIVHGELSTPDGTALAGFALIVQAPTRGAVDAILENGPCNLARTFAVEVHDWEFGGRR
jgi:hypothetical protein